MEQSPWEACQEIPWILWNLKLCYCVHKSQRLVSVLRFILILTYLCMNLLSGLLPSGFPTKIVYAFLIYSIYVTCSTHLILWFDHDNKIRKLLIMQFSSTYCYCLPLRSTYSPQHPSSCVVMWQAKFGTHKKKQSKSEGWNV